MKHYHVTYTNMSILKQKGEGGSEHLVYVSKNMITHPTARRERGVGVGCLSRRAGMSLRDDTWGMFFRHEQLDSFEVPVGISKKELRNDENAGVNAIDSNGLGG